MLKILPFFKTIWASELTWMQKWSLNSVSLLLVVSQMIAYVQSSDPPLLHSKASLLTV